MATRRLKNKLARLIIMKRTHTHFLAAAVGVSCFVAGGAHAEEFAQTKALRQTSMTRGFTQTSLPALRRAAAGSPTDVSAALIGKLCPECQVKTQKLGADLQSSSESFTLSVSADASAADFRDLTVETKSHTLAKPVAERLPASALEQAGRKFISSKLSSVIALGRNEELVPLLTAYREESLQDLSTGAITTSVAANRVVFGRKLNGVAVVGNGSTVVVTFANDGSVESFHYDWPKYETASAQRLVNSSTLLDRVQQAVSAHSGVAPAFTVRTPSVVEATAPVPLNTDTKLQSLQCGYYDAGSGAGQLLVQPGCVYHAVLEHASGLRQGYSGAVPGGQQFEADAKWTETQILK